MKSFIDNKAVWLCIAVVISVNSLTGFGQTGTKPLLQDIQVHREPAELKSATVPLVRKTGSSAASSATLTSFVKTSIPVLADAVIPGYSGVLVETLDGNIVVESGSNSPLNPASNVKIATAYAVLKTFGPDYRFPTGSLFFFHDVTFSVTILGACRRWCQ